MTYLLARPALRQALHESSPSPQELTHLEAIRKRVPLDTTAKYAPKAKNPDDAAPGGKAGFLQQKRT